MSARQLRKAITVPDGRRFYGRWPQQMRSTGEGPYIAALAKMLGGACEVALPVGRADVATDCLVFEVEPVRSWQTGMRQVLAYAGQTGQTPGLALFGQADYLPIFLFVRDKIPTAQLWVFRGRWLHISSRAKARFKYRPEDATPPLVGDMYSTAIPPEIHPFDSEVSPDVVDPWERHRRALMFERLQAARLAMKATR